MRDDDAKLGVPEKGGRIRMPRRPPPVVMPRSGMRRPASRDKQVAAESEDLKRRRDVSPEDKMLRQEREDKRVIAGPIREVSAESEPPQVQPTDSGPQLAHTAKVEMGDPLVGVPFGSKEAESLARLSGLTAAHFELLPEEERGLKGWGVDAVRKLATLVRDQWTAG